jgi:anti-sigma factor RsiW
MAGRNPLFEGGACIRAREWTSMRLDDELSPMEEELLERHLEACDGCSAFEKDVGWATDVVRLTASERSTRRVTVRAEPRSRSVGMRRTALAAAAALALGALVGIAGQGSSSAEPTPPSQVSWVDDFGGKGYPRAKIRVPAAPPLQPPPKGVI